MKNESFRIGHGYDVHAFEPGNGIILGGVEIPFTMKFRAHSDGDVLLHAVCDALLGASALGDIGRHFPDSDPAYSNISSRQLLGEVYTKVKAKGLTLVNLDVTVIAEKPRLAEFVGAMCSNLASDLDCAVDQVNVKATTSEGLGFIGEGKGIAVNAVALLAKAGEYSF